MYPNFVGMDSKCVVARNVQLDYGFDPLCKQRFSFEKKLTF